MKSFSCDLKDLHAENDFFPRVTVFYEDGHVYEIENELGEPVDHKALSIWDWDIINKRLIQNLLADEQWRPL